MYNLSLHGTDVLWVTRIHIFVIRCAKNVLCSFERHREKMDKVCKLYLYNLKAPRGDRVYRSKTYFPNTKFSVCNCDTFLLLMEGFMPFIVYTHASYVDRLAHTHTQTNPNEFASDKAYPFTHPLEFYERIMLDICRPDLYTKVHSNTDDNCFYCPRWHGQRTLLVSTGDIKPEMGYPRPGLTVTCMYNSTKKSM